MPVQESAFVEQLVASIIAVDEGSASIVAVELESPSSLTTAVQTLAAAARDQRMRRAILLAAERIVARERTETVDPSCVPARGTRVGYEGKLYDFGYVSLTGNWVLYEIGCCNMQDAISVAPGRVTVMGGSTP